jgi:DNA-binding XRE family transcriptional regulator
VRVIYFYVTAAAQIRLIAIYKKGIKDDLNAAEKKTLEKLNENWWEARSTKNCLPIWLESMQQHNEIIAGTRKPARITRVDAQSIKVLRAKAGLTQDKFAALIQVDLSTLRNWATRRLLPC